MAGQAVHVRIVTVDRQDCGVPGRDDTASFAFQSSRNEIGAAGRLSVTDHLVKELDQVIRQPHRDLLAHPNTVPDWDSVGPGQA